MKALNLIMGSDNERGTIHEIGLDQHQASQTGYYGFDLYDSAHWMGDELSAEQSGCSIGIVRSRHVY
ncbi:hypothetical protein D3C72_2003250 [compost metagenome]